MELIAQHHIAYTAHRAIEEVNELIALANSNHAPLVEAERQSIGILKTRVDLLLSFLNARQEKPGLRVIQGRQAAAFLGN